MVSCTQVLCKHNWITTTQEMPSASGSRPILFIHSGCLSCNSWHTFPIQDARHSLLHPSLRSIMARSLTLRSWVPPMVHTMVAFPTGGKPFHLWHHFTVSEGRRDWNRRPSRVCKRVLWPLHQRTRLAGMTKHIHNNGDGQNPVIAFQERSSMQ